MTQPKGSSSGGDIINVQWKEWDEILCPVCMDHPHNAVLLICSSHEKGCRPFVCDTSHRHSNCLDRLKNQQNTTGAPLCTAALTQVPANCPLCRGKVLGFRIEEDLRQYVDRKPRTCSRESCTFSGNYRELRRHARRAHPSVRPAVADPSRQREWRRLEHEREVGDIISAIQASSPGAVVVGDYVIDSTTADGNGTGRAGRSWWTTFFMLQMLQSPPPARSWRSHRRSVQRSFWDLNLPDLNEGSDGFIDAEEAMAPRRRRRFSRPSTEDDDGHEGQ